MPGLPRVLRLRVVVWALAAATAVLAFDASATLGVLVLAAGAIAVLLLTIDRIGVRVISAAALAPVASPDDVAVFAIPLAAALLAMLPGRAAEGVFADASELQRHLDRARRRGEPVHLLLARAHGPAPARDELQDLFRTSDTVSVGTLDGQVEVVAIMDDLNLQRDGVEARLRASLLDPAQLGWAAFPDDGYNLETLVEEARARAAGERVVVSARPVADRPAA